MAVSGRDESEDTCTVQAGDPTQGVTRSPFQLIAAVFTPFDERGRVDVGGVEQHCALLTRQGVDAAFVCGTTGEGALLTGEERRATTEAWIHAAQGALPILVHVGEASVEVARGLAAHAAASGASGVSAVAPYYFVPRDLDALVACCQEIAGGAPDLPFLYYHIPAHVRVAVSVEAFLARARDEISNFSGIKYTDENLEVFSRCVAAARPGEQMLFGRDELLLSALEVGARGAVGTTYSFMAGLYRKLIACFDAHDLETAKECQHAATAIIEVGVRFGGLAAFKVMTRWAGADCGQPRLPLKPLSSEAEGEMRRMLEQRGLWEHVGALR